MFTFTTFLAYTLFVALYAWYRLRKEKLGSQEGLFSGRKKFDRSSYCGLHVAYEYIY